jgi:sugar phosphate isomerase/epimerase
MCLNMACIKGIPLEDQVRCARDAGFHGVGLWMDDIDAALGRGASLLEISALLHDAGLSVEELCFLGNWQDCAEADFPSVLAQADRMSLTARSLGCGLLVAVPSRGPVSWREGPRRFREVCAVAASHDVRVALEFVGTADGVADIRTAWRFVEESGSLNGGLLLDTFHFFMGGSKAEDLEKIPVERIFLIHVSDAMPVSLGKLRTFHDYRTFPGEGTIDFAPLRSWIEHAGYGGAVSLEIWNQEMLKADPERTARRGMKSLRALLSKRGGA